MAKIQCYNCRKLTPVVAPKYRCRFCNYPLNKYIQADNANIPDDELIENPVAPDPEPELPQAILVQPANVENVLKQNQNALNDIQNLLGKLKPDEKLEQHNTGAVIVKINKNPEKAGKLTAGWLVVHTENKIPVTYELFEGNNVIGRPDGPHHVDIRIEDDEFVSRIHALITIKKDFLHRFQYTLRDDGSLTQGRISTNGIYVNGYSDRLPKDKVVYLRDGDTVQIGTTKLVFKSINETDDHISAFSSVAGSSFTETVAVRRI